MAKRKTVFVCQECGNTSVNWRGQCSACGSWNSFQEETQAPGPKGKPSEGLEQGSAAAVPLSDFDLTAISRLQTVDNEFNRVLGGGMVPGSLILIGGEPGIGKSTLLLQLALQQSHSILYVSGEESLNQIKIRASRIGRPNPSCYLLTATALETVLEQLQKLAPDVVILDSIQTLTSKEVENTAGSIPQIRETTTQIQRWAKAHHKAVILVGHITKEGFIAGPKVLEHMVDTVLYFEGEAQYNYRILRTIKNRFGSVAEIGIYEMAHEGLKPVANPSEILLSHRSEPLSGVAIAATLEGIRPMLMEMQALVAPASYGTPQRATTGFDARRLNMILAVLEKRCNLRISNTDVFLNVAGGMKVEDPSADLSVALALASSYYDTALSNKTCFAGEIGLSGEIRPVNQIEKRVKEAEKLGFETMFIPKFNQKHLETRYSNLQVKAVEHLEAVFPMLF